MITVENNNTSVIETTITLIPQVGKPHSREAVSNVRKGIPANNANNLDELQTRKSYIIDTH